jgi:hypothetical protein
MSEAYQASLRLHRHLAGCQTCMGKERCVDYCDEGYGLWELWMNADASKKAKAEAPP